MEFLSENLLSIGSFLFFALLIIAPILGRRKRFRELTALFQKLEKKRGTRIITLVHRQESMGLFGAQLQYIDLNDAEAILEAIRKTPKGKTLELMIHTPGGLVIAATQIARAVKQHDGPTKVYVPHFAMSGGTLIAMAADEIHLSDHAMLGPVDPQIYGMPAASIVRAAQSKNVDAVNDDTLILADVSSMALTQLSNTVRDLLKGTVSENAAISIAAQLTSGRWTHDYPIYHEEAQELGLNVANNMPQEFMQLMSLFPQRVQPGRVGYLTGLFGRKKNSHQVVAAPQQGSSTPPLGIEPTIGDGRGLITYGPYKSNDRPSQR